MKPAKRLFVLVLPLVFMAGGILPISSMACDEQKRPNIVFILSDDHRWDQLGCAGHEILKTPHIDRLAANGVRFENMFVTTSICAASRASIFTGMYERGHRYTFGAMPLARGLVDSSYPVLLRKAGYQTGFVGKFGVNIDGDPKSMFDFFRPLMRAPYFKKQPDGSRRHVTQIIGDRAIEFLQKQSDSEKPFCLSVSFNAPHAEDGDKNDHYPVPKIVAGMYDQIDVPPARLSDPAVFDSHPEFLKQSMHRERFGWRWDAPPKYARNMRGYWGMISGVDHVVGRIVDEIKKIGAAENTVVFFTGDNGYYLGQRGFAGKWSHYEESLRVPLVVYDPRNRTESGQQRVIEETALNIDLAATLLEIGGVEVPHSYQGRSLAALLDGETPNIWRTEFLCEHLFHIPGRIPKYEGVRGQRWTYARYFEQQPVYEFLHDLNEDPDQLKNYALDPAYFQQLDSMRKACDTFVKQNGGRYSLEKFPLKKRRPERKRKEGGSAVELDQQSASGVDANPKRPNVVLIVSDDQHWSDYSFMNHPVVKTPSLDQLARQSMLFVNGYVPTALCRPSLASLITGLYPHQHGITGNDPAREELMTKTNYRKLREDLIAKIDNVQTIPKLLSRIGYASFQSGKWWEGHYSRGGFTDGMSHGDPERGGRHGDEGLKIGREGLKPIEQFIDRTIAQEKPFFLWYAPFLPHTPHNPPQRLLDKYHVDDRPLALANYFAMCEWFDETCGELLDMLDAKNVDENTIVVYVTDNGWVQRTGETDVPDGWPAKYAPRSKQSPNEGGVRTPIMVRWLGGRFAGLRSDLVSSLDIAPTILAACGVEAPEVMTGMDLTAIIVKDSPADRMMFGEGYAHDVANIEQPQESLLYRWVIRDGFKLIRRYDGKLGRHQKIHQSFGASEQLYDLRKDPHENNNLANRRPAVVEELRRFIDEKFSAGTTAGLR